MNNDTLYQNDVNALPRAIYVALMGDPTLRLDPVGPPGPVATSANSAGINLSWTPSSDSVAGYHVYRANSSAGPYTRITATLATGTSYTDPSPAPGVYTYLVRAIKLQNGFSGSYFNPSQGMFASVTVGSPVIILQASRTGGNLVLRWNSQAGVSYHVQFRNSLTAAWSTLAGPVIGSDTSTSWTDTNPSSPQRFYRITSP